ncbi:nuclear transport factor 2 family protein [Loktanella sp. Alg231-35]|uniref:nuclear transport factor 2 family protein n=1 Tax=Loktanella sp. Alg231-35 TaxID=1922220 RepID=UPI00131EE07F|nr:nuclear transport factor 2 family protein [Loktanella sp. Alg231-35]
MNQMPLEITNFFLAMQAGPSGLGLLQEMFSDDAIYEEPFSGQSGPHRGPKAIAAAFDSSRTEAFNDAVITLGDVTVQDAVITVSWTCISEAIPGGRGSGKNEFQIRDGQICSLKTTLDMEGS